MELQTFKYLAALIILLLTITAAWLPFKKRLQAKTGPIFPRGELLATGIFLGAGLIHMLSQAASDFLHAGIEFPIAYILCGVTFLFLLLLEHIGMDLYRHKHASVTFVIILAIVMLSFHSLLAGTALGINNSYTGAVIVFIAIVAHKWAASFALAVQINKTAMPLKRGIILFSLFAAMAPIGIFTGNLLHMQLHACCELIEPIFNSLAAGTFIYIGTLHGLQRSVLVERCCDLKEFTWVIIGFSFMALIALIH